MSSKVEKYSKEDVDPKDVKWKEWKESVDRFVAKKQRMERTPNLDNSHTRAFPNQRKDPCLPRAFEWTKQKQLYCPPDLLRCTLVDTDEPTLGHEFGYVFCHRALYDRAQGIIDNSTAAIENGANHGYYLHELDSFVFDRLDKTIVVHEKGSFRVSAEDKQWEEMSVFEILRMFLVDRKVDLSKRNFTESFEKTNQTVPDLLSIFWKELLHPTGVTFQIDIRDDDFQKVFSYYSYHVFKRINHRKSLGSRLFRPAMFKGYNHHYKSFDALRDAIQQECITLYGRNYFKTEYLDWFPPLIMVITAEAMRKLLKEEYPSNALPQSGAPFDFSTASSYERIYALAMRHISSFVNIGKNHYNFILEVEYSGLGLGYNVKDDLAWNPLNGKRIVTEEVIFEARFDRALIDVTLDLKRAHKGLLIASCTRLPDVILPTGYYIADYSSSKMKPWETEEKGISRHLRTIHGGLYPQSDICIADNAGGEIAARTWIDQYAKLKRKDLLKLSFGGYSYQDWLESSHQPDLVEAMGIINGNFLANQVGEVAPVASGKDISTAAPILLDEAGSFLMDWQEIFNAPNDDGDEPKREVQARVGSTQDFDPRVAITDPTGRMRICEVGPNDKRKVLHVGDRDFIFDNVQNAIRASNSLYVYYAVDAGYHRHMDDYGETEKARTFPVRNYEAIKRLIGTGADINALSGIYGTPLALACVKGDYAAAKFLLGNGAKIDVKGPYGYPLELATAKGHAEVVKLLLKQTNPHASFYASAFQKACLEGQLDIVKVFVEKYELIGASLEGACARGHKEIVLYLLSKGATASSSIISQGLHMVYMYGHKGIFRILQSSSVKCYLEVLEYIQGIGSAGNLVSGKGCQLMRQMLRNKQRRGNAYRIASTTGRKLWTTLAAACAGGYQTIVHLFLRRGALFGSHRTKDTSAIWRARMGDHSKVIQLLLDNNTDVKNHGGGLGMKNRTSPMHGSRHQTSIAEDAGGFKKLKTKGDYHPWGLKEDLPTPEHDCGCMLCLLNHLSGNADYDDGYSDDKTDSGGDDDSEEVVAGNEDDEASKMMITMVQSSIAMINSYDYGDDVYRKEYDNCKKEVDDDDEEHEELHQRNFTIEKNLPPEYINQSTGAMGYEITPQRSSLRMGTQMYAIV